MIRILLMFIVLIAVPHRPTNAADSYIKIEMLRNAISKLESEYDKKYALLQQCEKENGNFKIAGASTNAAAQIGLSINAGLQKKLDAIKQANASSDTRSEYEKCMAEMRAVCAGTSPQEKEDCEWYQELGC